MSRWIYKFEIKPACWVFVPDDDSRKFGNQLKKDLCDNWKVPPYYAHLLPGGHVAALKRHLKHEIFMRADVEGFFDQINLSRVTRVLKGFFPYETARDAALRSVVQSPVEKNKSILPFGFVQSPILASICMRQSALGGYLERLNRTRGIHVSVYMDDIIVSTSRTLDEANSIFVELCETAERSNFAFGSDKLIPPTAEVSAFNISISKGKMLIVEGKLEEMAYKYLASENAHVREGVLGYAKSVSRSQAERLRKSLS